MTAPRLYAACLASYNNGVLHGRWIEASADVEEMQEQVSEMLRASRFPNVVVKHPETGEDVPSAEEWAMHDSEGLPSSFGEYSGLKPIAEFMELCEEHGMEPDDMSAIVSEFGTVAYATESLENGFCGTHESFKAYAEELADELMSELPEDHIARRYFDYDSYARDLGHDHTVVALSEGVAIFS